MTEDEMCRFGPADLTGSLGDNLLALNNAHARELSWLEPDHLLRLLCTAGLALRVGNPAAFLLAFDQDADHDAGNFLWVRARPRNQKAIFNRNMVPNINPNPRGRKAPKRGRKPIFDVAIFQERFNTIERVFGWEDKFRRLTLRFERISQLHHAFKSLAYSMINRRHFC